MLGCVKRGSFSMRHTTRGRFRVPAGVIAGMKANVTPPKALEVVQRTACRHVSLGNQNNAATHQQTNACSKHDLQAFSVQCLQNSIHALQKHDCRLYVFACLKYVKISPVACKAEYWE